MPGVVVTTSALSAASTSDVPESGRAFFAGRVERGSTTAPIRVRSLGELRMLCGDRQTYGAVWDACRDAFNEGIGEIYIARVVGTTPVAATITLNDRAGTPLQTIRVTAKEVGAWANDWKIKVEAGSISGTVTIRVQQTVNGVDVDREVHANLATVADIALRGATSSFTWTNLNSATAAPNNLPAVATSTLASGSDDSGTITAASYVAALDLFTADYGSGTVAIPGFAPSTVAGSSTIGAGIKAHVTAFRRHGILCAAPGTTYSSALTEVASFRGSGAENVVYIWPAIISTDGRVERTLTAEGVVAAWRARAHKQFHAGRVPAGSIATAASLVRPEYTVSEDVANALDAAGISVIRTVYGKVQLYGWRSLSTDENYPTANIADLRNTLAYDLARTVADDVFGDIDSDGQFASRVKGKLEGRLAAIKRRGGLYGGVDQNGKKDPGYLVDVETLNTPTSISQNVFRVIVYFRPSRHASLISIELVYTPTGVTFAVAA